MTKKFCKLWDLDLGDEIRDDIRRELDGGVKVFRNGADVTIGGRWFIRESAGDAVKFVAALNKLRRPLHLIKKDLDEDWAERVKARDCQTCVGCGVRGDKIGEPEPAHTEFNEDTGEPEIVKGRVKKDVLTAHHWLKTKSRAGMARWARPCGVTYHYAEHIHTLHENPCWVNLDKIYRAVAAIEGEEAIRATVALSEVKPTEDRVRALWLERIGNGKGNEE